MTDNPDRNHSERQKPDAATLWSKIGQKTKRQICPFCDNKNWFTFGEAGHPTSIAVSANDHQFAYALACTNCGFVRHHLSAIIESEIIGEVDFAYSSGGGRMSGNIYGFPGKPQSEAGVALGGSGPHDPKMQARVTRLEDQFDRIEALLKSIDDRVRKLDLDAAELKGRFAHLPTTWAMVTTVIGGQVALAGVIFAAVRLSATH